MSTKALVDSLVNSFPLCHAMVRAVGFVLSTLSVAGLCHDALVDFESEQAQHDCSVMMAR